MENESDYKNEMLTFFDSPERDSKSKILEDVLHLKENSLINQILEAYPEAVLILNSHRQIVAFNSRALEKFKTHEYFEIIGNRFGEAINCIHHAETKNGCGTSLFCAECGAAHVLKNVKMTGIAAEEECRITTVHEGKEISHNFYVYSRPIRFENLVYMIFALRDISAEKQREALERIFFHDVLNTASAVKGLSELLQEENNEEERIDITNALNNSAKQLVAEIEAQRELRSAEDGRLKPDFESVSVNEILNVIYDTYSKHDLAAGKFLKVDLLDSDTGFVTDSSLLVRSIGNLTKNALEASPKGSSINIYIREDQNKICFNIKSEKIIPENIQRQLFQRSFTTNGSKGRGIGLYSVKLIVEQYLAGKVYFVSNNDENTVFTLEVPVNPGA